jgi:hypothetical protein
VLRYTYIVLLVIILILHDSASNPSNQNSEGTDHKGIVVFGTNSSNLKQTKRLRCFETGMGLECSAFRTGIPSSILSSPRESYYRGRCSIQ